MRNDPRDDDRTGTTRGTTSDTRSARDSDEYGRVAPLDELSDFEVADGEPDIKGWKVHSSDGRDVGKVKGLIADTNAMKVRYLEVDLDKKELRLDDSRHVLIPIGAARLNDDDDVVLINRPATDFATLPEYHKNDFNRDYEDRLRSTWGSSAGSAAGSASATSSGRSSSKSDDYYGGEHYDDKNFWGKRRQGREDQNYLTRSEEEMRVGKRQHQAGEVEVSKHVETEHVRERVPVQREEVTVERRPISDEMRASGGKGNKADFRDDEIRVPIMAEEAVVEKRAVPKEEVVIRKHTVQDEQTVEADLKKERVDVNKHGDSDKRGKQR